jgi:hypothetical protein
MSSDCLFCMNNPPIYYTLCCARQICAICVNDTREDNTCICERKTAPELGPLDPIDPAQIIEQFNQQLGLYNEFIEKTAAARWMLPFSRDTWINAQQKQIDIASDIVARIENFPNMPHAAQYMFEAPGLIIIDRLGDCAVIPRDIQRLVNITGTEPSDIIIDDNIYINNNLNPKRFRDAILKKTCAKLTSDDYHTITDHGILNFYLQYATIDPSKISTILDYPYNFRIKDYARWYNLVRNKKIPIKYFLDRLVGHEHKSSLITALMTREDMTKEIYAEYIYTFVNVSISSFVSYIIRHEIDISSRSLGILCPHLSMLSIDALKRIINEYRYTTYQGSICKDYNVILEILESCKTVNNIIHSACYEEIIDNTEIKWQDVAKYATPNDKLLLFEQYCRQPHVKYTEVLQILDSDPSLTRVNDKIYIINI